MNKPSKVSNLQRFILDPLLDNVGQKFRDYRYYDTYQESDLTTNNNGIDIISHQLELSFENNAPIYISWSTIDGWYQYSLCVSGTSFCQGTESYIKQDKYWEAIIGKRLTDFKVYGYKEYLSTEIDKDSGKTVSSEVFYNEPHLIELEFGSEKVLGVGNFYLENDFLPKYAVGDDIWIIHNKENLNSFISDLGFDKLDKENCH